MINKLLIALSSIVLLAGCASTTIEKSWKDPNASVTRSNENKCLVLAMVKDESSRRVIEDELVKRFNNRAVVSYSILTADMMKVIKEESLRNILERDNFTHILMMRLVDVEKETSYVQGSSVGFYGGYGMYYGYGAGYYSNPGYYTTDKNYTVETTVYSINPDKLLWTGTTKTVNPSKMDKAVSEIADALTNKMVSDGFLK
jgi:hypothetical protein